MPLPLIPMPRSLTLSDSSPFTLTDATRVIADGDAHLAITPFLSQARRATGYPLHVEHSPLGGEALGGEALAGEGGNTLEFVLDESAAEAGAGCATPPGPEAYSIEITSERVTVRGRSPHALFNATQSLRQLLPAGIEAGADAHNHAEPNSGAEESLPVLADWQLPALTLHDWPEYAYRGLMIDVARSFLTVPEMKQIIDLASSAKISRLHWHLSDDQGWRIEISNDGRADGDDIDYTLLTEISGGTGMTERGYNGEPGRTGFYTQAQYAEVVAYAAERHLLVIPEIDLPGHTIGALAAIPQLNTPGASHAGTPEEPVSPPDGSVEVGHSYLDPHSEVTYVFARHVLRQLAGITPGPYLHIGGDEPLKMTERYGHEVYIDCVSKIAHIVRELGKEPAGWNELAEANAAPGTLVQYWQGEADATVAAAEAGAKIILSRGESSYLDQKYFSGFPVGLEWACTGDCDFPRYYGWEPRDLVPGLAPAHIAGVEGPLWSETLRGASQIFLMAFPRLYALAELAWSAPESRTGTDSGQAGFAARVGEIAPRLLLAGGNFYDGEKAVWRAYAVGYPASAGASRARIARVFAPGGHSPSINLDLAGAPVTLETITPRGPLHAGPIIDVWADLSAVPAGSRGRLTVGVIADGGSSAPISVT